MRFRTLLVSGLAALATAVLVANAQVPGVNSTLNSVFTLAYDNSTMKATYSATFGGLTAASAATDVCILTGSATKNIRVRRVAFNGYTATTMTDPVVLIKRSTANSGGTSTTPTPVGYDSNNSAATAVMRVYTANPTVGTTVGLISDIYLGFGAATNASEEHHYHVYGDLGSPIILRGVAQSLAINLDGLTYPAGSAFSCTFEWTEE